MSPGIQLAKLDSLIKVIIAGDSMNPTMKNGQEIIFKRYSNQNILIGDILLFKHPFIKNKNLVKRVTNITKSNLYFLQGDNPSHSTDSRVFGLIHKKNIIAIKKETTYEDI